jgi:diguanylate cyclase (GGDEF)-like protein
MIDGGNPGAGAAAHRGATAAGGLPPGVRTAGFDVDLMVRGLDGTELEAGAAGSLDDLLRPADPGELERAARGALAGTPSTIVCRTAQQPDCEIAVRLGPDPDVRGRGRALWIDLAAEGSRPVTREWAEELQGISTASRELARSTDPDEARQTICGAALSLCEADSSVLFEPDSGSGHLVPVAVAGGELPEVQLPVTEPSAIARALQTNTVQFTLDTKGEPPQSRACLESAGLLSFLCQPIARGRHVRAVLGIGWRQRVSAVRPRTRRLLEVIAVEGAVAIDRGSMIGRLLSLARTDPLTGLPNRRAWEETLERELARARREGAVLAVAMIDLDDFKDLNDARGHPAGDRLLEDLALAWQPVVRVGDTLARYGGDEFALLLPRCEPERIGPLIDRLRGTAHHLTSFSAGAVSWDGVEDGRDLIDRADRMLYAAKERGRGTVLVDRGEAPS